MRHGRRASLLVVPRLPTGLHVPIAATTDQVLLLARRAVLAWKMVVTVTSVHALLAWVRNRLVDQFEATAATTVLPPVHDQRDLALALRCATTVLLSVHDQRDLALVLQCEATALLPAHDQRDLALVLR